MAAVTPLTSLLGTLPTDPHGRGRAFERVCQWFLTNEPTYAAQLAHVWLWNEWPERWGPDAGIDLVAETTTGDLWAIQAKAYDPGYSITKHDIDTFLSESGRPCFGYRLLIATTDRISPAALRTMDDQAVPVGRVLRSQLEKANVRWPRTADQLLPGRPEPKRPLPHVREAIDAVCAGFETASRGQLIMACGTGKTLTGLWISESHLATVHARYAAAVGLDVEYLCRSLKLDTVTVSDGLKSDDLDSAVREVKALSQPGSCKFGLCLRIEN